MPPRVWSAGNDTPALGPEELFLLRGQGRGHGRRRSCCRHRVSLIVQFDDFVGDVYGWRRPKHRTVGNAHVDHHGVAVTGGVIADDGYQLVSQLLAILTGTK